MSDMRPVSLIRTASYLPESIVNNDFFLNHKTGQKEISPMFMGVKQRRHVSAIETPLYMITKAVNTLMDDLNLDPQRDIDMILTNVAMPREPFMGSSAIVAKRIGAKPKFVFDFHHSGCISFLTMLDLVKTYIEMNRANNALICNVQNAAGQIFAQENIKKKPQACVPGDGCGVVYVKAGKENPILSVVGQCHPESSEDMFSSSIDGNRQYWQTGTDELYLDFDEKRIANTIARGNKIVVDAMHCACKKANITTSDIDFLITTQPGRIFLRNWREALQLPKEKHLDTFAELGNLFGAAIPINLTKAVAQKKLQRGNKVMLAGFSHAGDFSGAAVIDWQPST